MADSSHHSQTPTNNHSDAVVRLEESNLESNLESNPRDGYRETSRSDISTINHGCSLARSHLSTSDGAVSGQPSPDSLPSSPHRNIYFPSSLYPLPSHLPLSRILPHPPHTLPHPSHTNLMNRSLSQNNRYQNPSYHSYRIYRPSYSAVVRSNSPVENGLSADYRPNGVMPSDTAQPLPAAQLGVNSGDYVYIPPPPGINAPAIIFYKPNGRYYIAATFEAHLAGNQRGNRQSYPTVSPPTSEITLSATDPTFTPASSSSLATGDDNSIVNSGSSVLSTQPTSYGRQQPVKPIGYERNLRQAASTRISPRSTPSHMRVPDSTSGPRPNLYESQLPKLLAPLSAPQPVDHSQASSMNQLLTTYETTNSSRPESATAKTSLQPMFVSSIATGGVPIGKVRLISSSVEPFSPAISSIESRPHTVPPGISRPHTVSPGLSRPHTVSPGIPRPPGLSEPPGLSSPSPGERSPVATPSFASPQPRNSTASVPVFSRPRFRGRGFLRSSAPAGQTYPSRIPPRRAVTPSVNSSSPNGNGVISQSSGTNSKSNVTNDITSSPESAIKPKVAAFQATKAIKAKDQTGANNLLTSKNNTPPSGRGRRRHRK